MTNERVLGISAADIKLITEEDVVEKNTRLFSTSTNPWLRLEPSEAICANQWIRIRYATSFLDDPVRPLIRFRSADADQIEVMNGAVCGYAQWTGRIPEGTVEIAISPVNRPGPFGFAIQAIESLSTISMISRGLVRDPLATLVAAGARAARARDVARNWLIAANCPTALARYPDWVKANSRQIDAFGLDAPRGDARPPPVRLLADISQGTERDFQTTLTSLQAQLSPGWTLYGIAPRDLAVAQARIESANEPRLCLLGGDTLPFAQHDLCAVVRPGDTLPAYAIAAVQEAAAREPGLAAIYGDEEARAKDGASHRPIFRPNWSPVRQEVSPYLGFFTFLRAGMLESRDTRLADLLDERAFADILLANRNGTVKHIRRILYRRATHASAAKPAAPAKGASVAATPRVVVIIPTCDRAQLLSRCIAGLDRTDYPALEVVVVDNGSTEPAALRLLDHLRSRTGYQVLRRPGRFNYSTLCNQGAAVSDAEFLVFLNNDIGIFDSFWLKALIRWAVRPDIGAVGAKLLYPNWPFRNRLQHVGVTLGLFGLAAHTYYNSRGNEPGYRNMLSVPHEVSAVTGACLAVERRKFETIGGFDADNLPVDMNDIDLCLRLAAQGWQSLWTPEAVLYHHEAASRGKTLHYSRRYSGERSYMRGNWMDAIRDDPYFHPAFSLYSKRIKLS